MALWQWDFSIIPKQKVIDHYEVIPAYLDFGWFETIKWWKNIPEIQLVSFFDTLLPRSASFWTIDSRGWGSSEGDNIAIFLESNTVSDVMIRVDMRTIDVCFLEKIVDFSKLSDFLLYSIESKAFIEPSLETLISEIGKSKKMGFLVDPVRFFNDKKYLEAKDKENRRRFG